MPFLEIHSHFDTTFLFTYMFIYIFLGLVVSLFVKPTVVIITDETDKIRLEVLEGKREILASNQHIIDILERKENV